MDVRNILKYAYRETLYHDFHCSVVVQSCNLQNNMIRLTHVCQDFPPWWTKNPVKISKNISINSNQYSNCLNIVNIQTWINMMFKWQNIQMVERGENCKNQASIQLCMYTYMSYSWVCKKTCSGLKSEKECHLGTIFALKMEYIYTLQK